MAEKILVKAKYVFFYDNRLVNAGEEISIPKSDFDEGIMELVDKPVKKSKKVSEDDNNSK